MSDPKPGLIERLLMRVFEYEDIRDQPVGNPQGDLYLRRFFILRNNKELKNKSKNRVYLHKFVRSDRDRHHHDHPFDFISLILKGGYWEEATPNGIGWKLRAWYRPGKILRRPATWSHRVILPAGKFAWTLVLTSGKKREWGFHTEEGWCHWRKYVNGVCMCWTDGYPKV